VYDIASVFLSSIDEHTKPSATTLAAAGLPVWNSLPSYLRQIIS